jgi:hypothetical protein
MPYDKDLRDLLRATKKVARPLPETIEERVQKLHESDAADLGPPNEADNERRDDD